MRNIKIVVEYDGTDFSGWQYQPDRRTVQGEIERAILHITGEDVRVKGSGRTDAGVHALAQVANFTLKSRIGLEKLRSGINALTGEDVYIQSIEEVSEEFDARFSAIERVYKYFIFPGYSPVRRRYAWEFDRPLDMEIMKMASSFFPGEKDFTRFATKDSGKCTIFTSRIDREGEFIVYTISGNRFLRRMVRGIVGTIVGAGMGKFSPEKINDIFEGRMRRPAVAPPRGLFLWEVKY